MSQEQIDLIIGSILEKLPAYLLALGGALLILLVGWFVSRTAGKMAHKAARRVRSNDALAPFARKVTQILVMIVAVIAALGQIGVPMASFLAVLGAAGLGIGLALKDTLSDLACGIILLVLHPFDLGDAVVVDGASGTVDEISLFATRLTTFDGIAITVRNSKVWGSQIHNLVVTGRRRFDVVVGVEYSADVAAAQTILLDTLKADARVLDDPAPVILVDTLADSSVNLIARYWVKTADGVSSKSDLTREIKAALDAAGIGIPFPQSEVRMIQ